MSTTIVGKAGVASARTWTFQFKNSGNEAVGNVTLNSLTISPSAGIVCTPVVKTGVPSSIPLLPIGTTGTLNVVIDFSACPTNARYSVTPGYSASGNAITPVVIGNQFQ